MDPNTYIGLLLLFALIWLFWDHLRLNRRGKHAFKRRVEDLRRELDKQKEQIALRSQRLGQYDFNRYNLEEVLVIQSNIELLEELCQNK